MKAINALILAATMAISGCALAPKDTGWTSAFLLATLPLQDRVPHPEYRNLEKSCSGYLDILKNATTRDSRDAVYRLYPKARSDCSLLQDIERWYKLQANFCVGKSDDTKIPRVLEGERITGLAFKQNICYGGFPRAAQ